MSLFLSISLSLYLSIYLSMNVDLDGLEDNLELAFMCPVARINDSTITVYNPTIPSFTILLVYLSTKIMNVHILTFYLLI